MQELQEILKKILQRVGINDKYKLAEYMQGFNKRLYVLFVNEVLQNKMSEEEYLNKIELYTNLIDNGELEKVEVDLKEYLTADTVDVFGKNFVELLREMLNDLKLNQVITEDEFNDIMNDFKNEVVNKVALKMATQAGTVQEGLQALAANNIEQVQPIQAMVEPEMTQAPVMNEPNQVVQAEPVVASTPVMGDQTQAPQTEPQAFAN